MTTRLLPLTPELFADFCKGFQARPDWIHRRFTVVENALPDDACCTDVSYSNGVLYLHIQSATYTLEQEVYLPLPILRTIAEERNDGEC